MSQVKICIIEDEMIIAEDLRVQLSELGYKVTGIAAGYDEAVSLLAETPPDLAMIDILLEGEKDGIDLGRYIRVNYHMPFIFLTSHADKITVERAKQVHPDGYLMKPFEPNDLYVAIEMAISNFATPFDAGQAHANNNGYIFKDSIFIKKDYMFIKVLIDHIRWIQTYGNYLILHCLDEKHMIRSSMKDFLAKLPPEKFLQTHKSYAVNIRYIDKIEYTQLFMGEETIPIGRSYVDRLRKKLDIFR